MKNFLVVFIVAFGLSIGAYADVYRWIGGDGEWSDKGNWGNDTQGTSGESIPETGDTVRFWAGKSVSVKIDGDYSVYMLELMTGTQGKADTVVFTGDGSLTVGEADGGAGTHTHSYFNVYAHRCLKLYGVELTVSSGVQYNFAFAEMVVGDGSVYRPRYHYLIWNDARIVLDGGQILELPSGGGRIQMEDNWNDPGNDSHLARLEIRNGVFNTNFGVSKGIFRMSGGCFVPSNTGSIFSNSAVVDVKVTGGEVVLKDGAAVVNRGVFPDGAVLTLGNNSVLRNLATAENPDLPLNGGEVRGNGRFVASTNFNITGGGHLTFGGGMQLSPGSDDPIDRVVLDVDSLVLGTHLQRPYQLGGVGDTTGTNLHIYFPREVVVGATNADWYVSGSKTAMHIEEGLTIDTTDRADGVTGRSIMLRRPTFSYGAYFRTIGCGVATSSLWSDPGERLSELSIGEGSTAKFELQYNKTFKTDLLSVGDGASLGVAARRKVAFFEAEAFSFENNSRILASVSIGNHTDSIVPGFIGGPLAIDAFNDGVSPQLDFTSDAHADTWDYRFVNGSLVLCRKNVDLLTENFSGNRWTGIGDGRFDNSANWSLGVVPDGTNTTAVFDGVRNTTVTVPENGADLYSLRFLDMAGPFVMYGGALRFESRLYNQEARSAIYSASAFPVVISNDVCRSWTGGNHAVIAVCSAGSGYIALNGNVDGYARFEARGDVRILGKTKAWNVIMKASSGTTYLRPTKITVYGGAELLASNQTIDNPGPQDGFEIKENGVFTVKGSKFGYDTYGTAVVQRVDGLFDVQAPLCGKVGHWLVGNGRVKFKDTGSAATADFTIRLGEKIRFSAETFVKPITVEDEPTLCSENSWVYNAGDLTLPEKCTLTVDTQDADSDTGYECTFSSAIIGKGTLKVKGAGSLKLSAQNNIEGGLVLDGGTIVCTKPQTFGSLTGTGKIVLGAEGGEVAALTVAGDVDLSRINLGCKDLGDLAAKGWVSVMTLPADSAVTGELTLPSGHWKSRIVSSAGGKTVQVRLRPGISIVVR